MKQTFVTKLISVLATGVLLAGTLAGCGTGSSQPNNVDKKEAVTLHFSSWRTEEIEAFKTLNDEFHKQYPNITVSYEPVKDTEYDSVMNTSLQTGKGPDLFYLRPFDLGASLNKAGYLLPIDKTKVPNLANINQTQTSIYQTPDGTVYALPYIYVAYGFIYNQEIFDKYNLSVPKTWDEYFKVLDTLKGKDVTPLALGYKDPWVLNEVVNWGNYANFVGGETWRKDLLAGKAKINDPKFVEFLSTLQRWNKYLPANPEGIGYTDTQALFLSGKAAIFPAGSWEIGNFHNQNPNIKLGFFVTPVNKVGDKQWVGFNGGAGVAINAKTPHAQEALTYVNWLASKEVQIETGNLMAGLFPCASVSTDSIKDPVAKAWLEAGGKQGENFAIGWGLVGLNSTEPSSSTLISDNLPLMMLNKQTPQETAEKVQKGLDQWYKPQK